MFVIISTKEYNKLKNQATCTELSSMISYCQENEIQLYGSLFTTHNAKINFSAQYRDLKVDNVDSLQKLKDFKTSADVLSDIHENKV